MSLAAPAAFQKRCAGSESHQSLPITLSVVRLLHYICSNSAHRFMFRNNLSLFAVPNSVSKQHTACNTSDTRMQDAMKISAVTRCPGKSKQSASPARTKLPICVGIRAMHGNQNRRQAPGVPPPPMVAGCHASMPAPPRRQGP
jgi:hypothetical protein